MSERRYTFTLRVMRAEGVSVLRSYELAEFNAAVSEAEATISNALPSGWYCKIDESGEGVDLAAVKELERIARDER